MLCYVCSSHSIVEQKKKGCILQYLGEHMQPSKRRKQELDSAIMSKLAWLTHDSLISKNGCSRLNAGAEPETSLRGSDIYASPLSLHPSLLFLLFLFCCKTSHKHDSLLICQLCLWLSFQYLDIIEVPPQDTF